jgi:hypothetical protein
MRCESSHPPRGKLPRAPPGRHRFVRLLAALRASAPEALLRADAPTLALNACAPLALARADAPIPALWVLLVYTP